MEGKEVQLFCELLFSMGAPKGLATSCAPVIHLSFLSSAHLFGEHLLPISESQAPVDGERKLFA